MTERERTRSEYRWTRADAPDAPVNAPMVNARPVRADERDAVAELLLAGYRGTIDDEGEDHDDATAAIDHYFATIAWPQSLVVEDAAGLVAMSFVVVVRERYYIDPVVVHPRAKGTRLGRSVVAASLASLAAVGVDEVGATITDGNVPSERLFAALGFERIGAWA